MIILRQKDYSKLDNIADLKTNKIIFRAPLEFIKSVEMINFNNGEHVKHWIIDKCYKEGIKYFQNIGLSPQLAFSLAVENDYSALDDQIGLGVVSTLKRQYQNNIVFLDKVINKMLTESSYNEVKYDTWFKNHVPKSPEEYTLIFKVISLALSGQLTSYEYENPYNIMYKLSNKEVNYSITKNTITEPIKIINILAEVLSGICGVSDTQPPINKLINYRYV